MEKISHVCTMLMLITVNLLQHFLSVSFYAPYFMLQMPYLTYQLKAGNNR